MTTAGGIGELDITDVNDGLTTTSVTDNQMYQPTQM